MIRARLKLIGAASILLATAVQSFADASPVATPAKRQEVLARGKKMLSARSDAPVEADPFHSEKFTEMVFGPRAPVLTNAPVAAQKNDRDILQSIAASLKPSGNFNVGGQQTLVFGQKRVKAGGLLTITFEGTEYTLEVTAIERTSFTLRLNREEFTRPIK